jgi:hypothetical protein
MCHLDWFQSILLLSRHPSLIQKCHLQFDPQAPGAYHFLSPKIRSYMVSFGTHFVTDLSSPLLLPRSEPRLARH